MRYRNFTRFKITNQDVSVDSNDKFLCSCLPDLHRKVILATDLTPDYYFCMPLSVLFWRRAEYQPLIFLVGSKSFWLSGSGNISLEYARKLGASFIFLNTPRSHIIKPNNWAQISRLCCGYINQINDDTYCLTGDMDMLAVDKEFFNQSFNKPVQLFCSNVYDYTRFPMCYIGMKKRTWREIIGNVNLSLEESLIRVVSGLRRINEAWGYDETFFFKRISAWHGYKDKCQFIERENIINPGLPVDVSKQKGIPSHLPLGRKDRSNWDYKGQTGQPVIDIHLMRKPFEQNNWELIINFVKNLLNDEDLNVLNQYYLDFCKSIVSRRTF